MTNAVKTKDMAGSVNEREIVLDILMELEKADTMSHMVIGAALTKYQYLLKNQRSFIARLAQGTLERRIELDYIIDSYSKTPVKKMKPLIRNLLELSVYQLKYMDSVPVSAVCNEAVKLAGKRSFTNLKGFVNGVLRNIARNPEKCIYPDKNKDYVKYLSVTYSMPEWLINLWRSAYSDSELEQMLQGFYEEKTTTIRCNTQKLSVTELQEKLLAEGITAARVEGIDYALSIKGYDYLSGLDSFRKGEFFVQDISSMLAGELAAPGENDNIIDVCAAPGGKSMNAALKMKNGHVEARDLSDFKVSLIEENLERLKLDNITTKVWDALCLDQSAVGRADIVLADLPCSGLGIIGRKPDIKYHVDEEKLKSLAALQREILSVVCQYVKPGGYLIYSTCTINREENEENAQWFTKEFPFTLEGSMRQLIPGRDGTDGFFMARFKKDGEVSWN